MHVVVPASEQTQVFSVDGHSWPVEPGTPGTTHVGAATVGGMQSLDVRLDGGAGGPERLAGDYRYGNARLPYAAAGMYGVLRVHPPSQLVAGLTPLPAAKHTVALRTDYLAAAAGLLLLLAVALALRTGRGAMR